MATKIDRSIVSFAVQKEPPSKLPNDDVTVVVYDRPLKTDGRTYKIEPAVISSAMYITINNILLDDGTSRPFEVFINTKSVKDHEWITALTRMLSSVFRVSGDISFVVEELKQVYGPNDSYWHKGKLMPSVVAHIGEVIEKHFDWTETQNASSGT